METSARLRDTSILVTGAGGSIGSALSLQLASLHPRQLVLLDASEQALVRLQSALLDSTLPAQPKLVLGSVTDPALLNEVFETHRPQLIFHAAAHKHVSLLEEHPLEAIANNALGTHALNECAENFGVKRIVLLSTDKAVAPVSILGATKRIAEQITLAHRGVVLRLGNVLGTEGSVSETFLRQIAAGGPVTVTDRDAERYFLTGEEAVGLLLAAAVEAAPRSLLAPHLDRQYSIASLADFLISACTTTKKPAIGFIGLRPGEKRREALWDCDEEPLPSDANGYLELRLRNPDSQALRSGLIRLKHATQQRDLTSAMEVLQDLVPDYRPSAAIRALACPSSPEALQR